MRPNSKMMPRPMTKGGVIIGRMARARSNDLARKPVRRWRSARPRPSRVVERPVATASARLFHSTPHPAPERHARLQMSSPDNLANRAPRE